MALALHTGIGVLEWEAAGPAAIATALEMIEEANGGPAP